MSYIQVQSYCTKKQRKTADKSFQAGVLFVSNSISEALSNEVIKKYALGYKFEISDKEYRGERLEAETASLLYTSGIINQNKANSRVGMDVNKDGDNFINDNKNTSENAINADSKLEKLNSLKKEE